MKALLVYKKSSLEIYSKSENEDVKRFLQNEKLTERFKLSDERQKRSLEKITSDLDALGIKYDKIYRAELRQIADYDVAIALGGDGTFLEVSHYTKNTPLIGVNSDPALSVGFYCHCNATNFKKEISNIDSLPRPELNRFQLNLNGTTIPEQALNDIQIKHMHGKGMTSYDVSSDGITEQYKCDILLACTAAGSSGFMWNANGIIMPLRSDEIQYTKLIFRKTKSKFTNELKVTSFAREGAIFIDGDHVRYNFTLGDELTIKKGNPLQYIGDLNSKRHKLKYLPSKIRYLLNNL